MTDWLSLRGHTHFPTGATFSHDGKRLATCGLDKTIRIWDVESGLELLTLRGHTDMVWRVQFNSDSTSLVSASADGTVRIWEASLHSEATRQLLLGWNQESSGRDAAALATYRRLLKNVEDEPVTAATAHQRSARIQLSSSEDTRNLPDALESARQATRHSPTDPSVWDTLREALYRLNQYREAVEAAQHALSIGVHCGRSYYIIAMAQWQLGNREAARLAYIQGVLAAQVRGQARIGAEAKELLSESVDHTAVTEAFEFIDEAFNMENDGRPQEAESNWRNSIERMEALPSVANAENYQRLVPSLSFRLARLLSHRGASVEAVPYWNRAIAGFRRTKDIRLASASNSLAWVLATSSNENLQDPQQAVQLALEATKLRPRVATFWNTLGVAHYRSGQWNEAIQSLTRSVRQTRGGSGEDFFFLAMAHWQLGNKEAAELHHEKGVAWTVRFGKGNMELERFRAESARLIGAK